jgi:hypothetical protein
MFKKNRNWMYLVLILVFSVIFFFEKKQFDETLAPIEADDNNSGTFSARNPKAGSISQKSSGSTTSAKAEKNSPNETANAVVDTDTAESLKKFQAWFTKESSTLEDRTANQSEKESQMRAKAKSLSSAEINSLKEKSYSTDASANERILATYLLSLGSEQTSAALTEITLHKLSLPSPQPVHSTGETQLMQEKAIRTMAIDELFSRAKANPAIRPAFLQMANQIPDPNLRKYAVKRYGEFK